MKTFFTAVALGMLLVLAGCSQSACGTPPKAAITGHVTDAANVIWKEYTVTMQKQWDQFDAKFAALKDCAAKAEGQAKTDLDKKLAEAKVRLDSVAVKLAEMKSASADHWEKATEGVSSAFDDLKKIFA